MQLEQIPTFTECHACEGYGSTQDYVRFDFRYSDFVDCEICGGGGLIQSGDLCRSSVQSPDVLGQESNHKFLSSESKITRDSEESQQIESEHQNGLEIIPHSLRLGGLRKEAGLENRDVKESPLSITSGLLYHGVTNHD